MRAQRKLQKRTVVDIRHLRKVSVTLHLPPPPPPAAVSAVLNSRATLSVHPLLPSTQELADLKSALHPTTVAEEA